MSGTSGPDNSEAAKKAPDAFRTISEVADELELPQHVLRFWETRFSQIKPLKRGGGRRYYRPQDVDLLRGIRHLLYGEGYTIRGVQRILRQQGLRFVVAAWHGAVDASIGIDSDLADNRDRPTAPSEDESASAQRMAQRLARTRSRPLSPPPKHTAAALPGLPPDAARRLETTLSELLEMKRLLDAAR